MMTQYGHVLLFVIFGFGFAAVNLAVSKILQFTSRDETQKIAYECGMEPIGTPYLSCTSVLPVCDGPTGDCGSVCGARQPSM